MNPEMTISVGILTVSDRSARGERPDTSGSALSQIISQQGWKVDASAIVADEFDQIIATLIKWSGELHIDLILTTGGTGFAPRDITPEATRQVIQKEAPGLAEAMRSQGARTNPHSILSRAVAGIRNKTLIINLPGSPSGASESLEAILAVLPHAIEILQNSPDAERGHRALHVPPGSS